MAQKKKKPSKRRRTIEINVPELDTILDKAINEPLSTSESHKVKSAVHAMARRLQPPMRTTERSTALRRNGGDGDDNPSDDVDDVESETDTSTAVKKARRGHGRNGADDYVGTTVVKPVPHAELTPKCVCPGCQQGKVYPLSEPRTLLRIVGMPPIQATKYELQQLRCNLCGEVYTATAPEDIGDEKYDASVASMLAILRYGSGTPWYRIARLQQRMGVPMPEGTQWGLVDEAANKVLPVHQELVRQAAQGDVIHRDDTKVRILDEIERPDGQDEDRTGLNTTGIVSKTLDEHLIAIFCSGPQHAGENTCDLLQERHPSSPPPMLMSDALSSNDKLPAGLEAILCNCLTHGRRQFVNVFENFPDECGHVIDEIAKVYHYDDQARQQGLDDQQRLDYHKKLSKPVMTSLKTWMETQLEEKEAESNSGLGKAIRYFLKRWDKLTRFLEHPGAPLDSNIVERALKKAVLIRKNSLFYKTQHGADVGDLFLTLIHTCELNNVNSFLYLTELQRHADEIRSNPSAWLPWNHHLQLRSAPD